MQGELSYIYYWSSLCNLIIYHILKKRSPRSELFPPGPTTASYKTIMALRHTGNLPIFLIDSSSLFDLPGCLCREKNFYCALSELHVSAYVVTAQWTAGLSDSVPPSLTFLSASLPLLPVCHLFAGTLAWCWAACLEHCHRAFGSWTSCDQAAETKPVPCESIWQIITFSFL